MIRNPLAQLSTALVLSVGTFGLAACGSGHGSGSGGPSGTASTGSGDAVLANPDAFQLHALDKLNKYRAKGGVAPLVLDANLTTFASAGNQQLADGGGWHAHFQSAGDSIYEQGFCGQAAENQGMESASDEDTQIDDILEGMYGEGPSGGHYQNMMNSNLTRVGIALSVVNGTLWLTNDFSSSCN